MQDTAKVTYIARDRSNNISTAYAVISYTGNGSNIYTTFSAVPKVESSEPSTEEQTTEIGTENPTTEFATIDSSSESESSEEESSSEPETTEPETTEEETETTTSVSPVLTLKQTELTINAGEPFRVYSYVENITDDKDDRNYLYGRICIDGSYDIHTPGDYELYIYCSDSNQNMSNKERFILHVVQP